MLGGVGYRDAGAQMQRKMSTGTKKMRAKGDTLFMSPSTGPNLTESDKAIQLQTIRLTTPCRHLAVFVIATSVPMTITIRITIIITLQTSYAYTPLQLITFRIVTSARGLASTVPSFRRQVTMTLTPAMHRSRSAQRDSSSASRRDRSEDQKGGAGQ